MKILDIVMSVVLMIVAISLIIDEGILVAKWIKDSREEKKENDKNNQ